MVRIFAGWIVTTLRCCYGDLLGVLVHWRLLQIIGGSCLTLSGGLTWCSSIRFRHVRRFHHHQAHRSLGPLHEVPSVLISVHWLKLLDLWAQVGALCVRFPWFWLWQLARSNSCCSRSGRSLGSIIFEYGRAIRVVSVGRVRGRRGPNTSLGNGTSHKPQVI